MEVVAGFVMYGGDEETVVVAFTVQMFGVVGEMEGGAGGGGAYRAFAFKVLQAGVEGFPLMTQQAFALGVVLPAVLAGVVPGGGG